MKLLDKLISIFALTLVIAVAAATVQVSVAQVSAPAEPSVALPVLMYHHILNETSRHNDYTISPEAFRSDLAYLKAQGYTPVLIRDLLAYANEGKALPEKPVMITFDDGYESFYEYAFPILQEMEFPAVFSVVGRYADEYTQTDDHHIRYSHSNWAQLKELQDSGIVEIQNHSYNLHSNEGRKGSKKLPGESQEAYRKLLNGDLGKLQSACTEHLGVTPTTFTYPFGHISTEALPVLKGMGFQAAMTCEEKINYLTGDPEELYHIKRFNRPNGKSAQTILEQAAK